MLMREICPPGLAGLMIVTFFAAFMSTISTQMNWGASYLVRDFIIPLFPKLATDERKLLIASQFISVLVLVLGTLMSWFMVEQNVSVDDGVETPSRPGGRQRPRLHDAMVLVAD